MTQPPAHPGPPPVGDRLAPVPDLLRAAFTTAMTALTKPVHRRSQRNAWTAVCEDRAAARARAAALLALAGDDPSHVAEAPRP